MKRSALLVLGLLVWSQVATPHPAVAGPLPFADMVLHVDAPAPAPQIVNLHTRWGFGVRENNYNQLIAESVTQVWTQNETPLPPLLYKSLVAVESSFNPSAVSYSGAAGIAQLMPDTARRFGVAHHERMDPAKAVPAGIQALQEKCRVVLDPGNYYNLVGQPGKSAPWGDKVAGYYRANGQPQGEDRWCLVLGAYNGGGGTILRAMAYAVDQGLDPRRWDSIAGPVGHPQGTPLFRACTDIFGARNAARKSAELAAYPRKIMSLYRSALTASR